MPLLLRTHQSLAQSKFPLCHPPAARVGWTHEEEAVGRQLFPARLRGRVRVGCAWDCSLPTPSAPSEQRRCLEGSGDGADPRAPPPQAARRHPGVCRASLNPRRVINPFPQVRRLLPGSDQHHPALKAAPLLLGETSVIKKQQAPEIRNTERLERFQNSCPSLMPVLAPSACAVNHWLVFTWSRSQPRAPEESTVCGQKESLPPEEPVLAGPLQAPSRRTKVLPPQRQSRAAPRSAALPSPAQLAHNGLFQGNLRLGEARYFPGY